MVGVGIPALRIEDREVIQDPILTLKIQALKEQLSRNKETKKEKETAVLSEPWLWAKK